MKYSLRDFKRYIDNLHCFVKKSRAGYLCRIAKIYQESGLVVIYCKKARTFLKLNFAEVIDHLDILCNLPSIHACWVGYYYEKACRNSIGIDTFNLKIPHLCLHRGNNKYRILTYQINFRLVYQNTETQEIFKDSASQLAKKEYLISDFSQTQACYIGMLAAIESAKLEKRLSINNKAKRPLLKLVK